MTSRVRADRVYVAHLNIASTSGILFLVFRPTPMRISVRHFVRTILVVGTASLLGAATPQKPNFLFIAIDDLRDWVGYIDREHQAKTPNIDRLSKMGLSFTRAYCA